MITSKEFAKKLGISQSTVSRAMNDSPLVPDEKKQYIQQKAAEYGFVLNSQARSLKTNRTGTVGIMFPRHYKSMICNLMLAHMYDLIQRELINYGYDILTVYDYSIEGSISEFERIVRCRKVDGFISMRINFTPRELKLIRDNNIPCVCMMHANQVYDYIDYFISDSEYSAYIAGKYLGEFKEYVPAIILLSVQEEKIEVEKRLSGFRRGLGEVGRSLPEENIFYCDLTMEAGYNLIIENQDFFKNQKVSILTHCDVNALGAIDGLLAFNRQIPEDAQVMGMDDVPISGWRHPGLSTMHVPAEEMVKQGCAALRDLIEKDENNAHHVTLKPKLIIRDTTSSKDKSI